MDLPIVGPSYHGISPDLDDQRTVNFYLEQDPYGKRPNALIGTPGLRLKCTCGLGPIRGGIDFDGNAYFASGNQVWKVDPTFTPTALTGTLTTSTGPASFAKNPNHFAIVDGTASGYTSTGAALTLIAAAGFAQADRIAFNDSYGIINLTGTQQYGISSNNDMTAWNAIDRKSAESDPDSLVSLIADEEFVYLFGVDTSEIHYNTVSGGAFPYKRAAGGVMSWGIVAKHSPATFDNGVGWLGRSKKGGGDPVVLFSRGPGVPRIISTRQMEAVLRRYGTLDDAYALSYMIAGHFFYELTFPTAKATWLYDSYTKQWTELASDSLGYHRASCHVSLGNTHLVGDPVNGNIYELDPDYFFDNTAKIRRVRRTPIISAEGAQVFYDQVRILCETGVGNADVTDPKISLRWSDDRGRHWSYPLVRPLGQAGQFKHFPSFNRLGSAKDRIFELEYTDPAKIRIFGAEADVSGGKLVAA